MIYQISLTKKQLEVVEQACELLCRLYLGQLKEVADLFTMRLPAENIDEAIEQHRALKDALVLLTPIVTGMVNPHASFGVGSEKAHPNHAIAYEIWRVIECTRNSHSQEPLKLSPEPLPKIEILKCRGT